MIRLVYEYTNKVKDILIIYAICRDYVYFCQDRSETYLNFMILVDILLIANHDNAYCQQVLLNEILTEAVAMTAATFR